MTVSGMSANETLAELKRIVPQGIPGIDPVKMTNQTIQFLASLAHTSKLTPYLARIWKVDQDWLRDASGPSPDEQGHSAQEPSPGTGYLDSVRRTQIYSRLLAEIQKTGRKPLDVARRLKMTERDFLDRASHGDLSLEDLAETVIFLGEAASLDFIVLGRFPKGDLSGPVGAVFAEVKERTSALVPETASGSGYSIKNLPRHGVVPGAPERRTFKRKGQ